MDDGGATGTVADGVAEEKAALQRAADAVNVECGAGNWTVSWQCFEEASRKQRRSITPAKLREYRTFKDGLRQVLARGAAADDAAARAEEEEAAKRFAIDALPEVAGAVPIDDLYSDSSEED